MAGQGQSLVPPTGQVTPGTLLSFLVNRRSICTKGAAVTSPLALAGGLKELMHVMCLELEEWQGLRKPAHFSGSWDSETRKPETSALSCHTSPHNAPHFRLVPRD